MCPWMMDTDSLIRSLCSAKLLLKAEAELSDVSPQGYRLPAELALRPSCGVGTK